MKKIIKILVCVATSLCLVLMLIKPEVYIKSAFFGIKLWAVTVLPALLPFFFLTSLLSKLGVTSLIAKIFKKPCGFLFRTGGASAFAFTMSLISGYPVGAKIIADLYKNGVIDKNEATRASTFCSTSGPLFIVGSVGIGMFGSKQIGFIILFTHIISAFLCGIIFRFYGKNSPKSDRILIPIEKSQNALYDCVYSSVISVACVGGFICVFSLFLDAFKNLNLLLPLVNLLSPIFGKDISTAFLYGLIECTNGCKMLASCSLSTYSLAFASALVSFGGVSIWAQSSVFLAQSKVNLKIFFLSKTLQAVFSFLLTVAVLLAFPII